MAALQIACHFDLAEAMKAEPATRARIVLRLERMIERERQRGARKHWSYDLNRHIALKQALGQASSCRTRRRMLATASASSGSTRSAKRKRRPQAPLQTSIENLPQL